MNIIKKCCLILALLFLLICPSSPARSKNCDFVGIHEKISYLREKIGMYPPRLTPNELKLVKRKYENTTNDLNNCLKQDPNNAEIEWRLGECYRLGHNLDLKGAWDNSERHLKKALSLDPKNINAHIALGRLYVNTDTSFCPKAEDLFKKALELSKDKSLPEAHDGLFFSYYYQGKFEQAVKEADTILVLHPDDQTFKELREFALCRANGQDCPTPLFPVSFWGINGYINKRGQMVLELQCDFTGEFREGLAIVKSEQLNKKGYIDKTGKLVIDGMFYREIDDFHEGLARVKVAGKWGYINKKGTMVVKPQFIYAEPFSHGLAKIKTDQKYGYIDKWGHMLISPQFYDCRRFSENVAAAKINDKWGYIDTAGKVVIEAQFDLAWDFLEGLAPVKIGGKYGYIDSSGKVAIAPRFDGAANFHDGLAMVQISGKWGYIDKIGEVVIAPQFDAALGFSEGLAAVKVSGKCGYIDKTGRIVIKPEFDGVSYFKDGLAQTSVGLAVGYIDKEGKYVWGPAEIKFPAISFTWEQLQGIMER